MFFVLFLAGVMPVAGQAKGAEKQPHSSLKLTVRTDRQEYRISDEVRMEVQLLNTSSEDIYIWEWDLCWNLVRGLSMHITTPDGSPVTGDFLLDCVPPPPREGDPYAFVKVGPQQFYGRVNTFKVRDVVNMPGKVNVLVTYNSFLSASFVTQYLSHDPISKLPVWTMEKPTITAPPICMVITPERAR
jgi:hypothetical protein